MVVWLLFEDKEKVYGRYLNENGSPTGQHDFEDVIISLNLAVLDYRRGITAGPNLQDH